MKHSKSNHQNAAKRFWDAFKSCIEENRVKPDRSVFYVKWAQAFVDFLPEKRLRDRSGADIHAFLTELGKRPGIQEWQVAQAGHALKILFETFLPNYAPKPASQQPSKNFADPPFPLNRHGDAAPFKDCVIPGEVERKFSPLLENLKSEIRSRHYSIRTETAYLEWTRRFIAFQAYGWGPFMHRMQDL